MDTITVGPWEATPTYPQGEFVVYSKTAKGRVESECRRVAYVYSREDARLIVAAPDMLDELKWLYAKYGYRSTADVIAKAECSAATDHPNT